jgi:hypothetical protein
MKQSDRFLLFVNDYPITEYFFILFLIERWCNISFFFPSEIVLFYSRFNFQVEYNCIGYNNGLYLTWFDIVQSLSIQTNRNEEEKKKKKKKESSE